MGWAQVKYSTQTGEAFFKMVLEDIVVKEKKECYTILAQRDLSTERPAVVHDIVYMLVCSRATFTAGKQHPQFRDF